MYDSIFAVITIVLASLSFILILCQHGMDSVEQGKLGKYTYCMLLLWVWYGVFYLVFHS